VFKSYRLLSTWLLLTCLGACAQRNQGPEIPSSAGDPSYAERLPDNLTATGERYDKEATVSEEISGSMSEFPSALSEPDWAIVGQVYDRADEEGRSAAYVEHQREEVMLGRFLEQERKPLVRRIAASNEYVTKEKGCEVELWGATDRGLEKGFEERLEERRRSDSGAHQLITLEQEKIGKKNEKTLRDQTDLIRFSSYVVHIGLWTEEEEVRRRVDEGGAARSALEDHIEEMKARPEPDSERIAQAEAALKNLDPAIEKAKQRLETAEQKRADLKQKYDEAFQKLKQAVEAAAEAQAQAAEGQK
jgi:hypothetical protein